jgi:hypothetical protein
MIVSLKRTRSRDNVFAILSERSLKTTNKRSTTWNFTEEAEGAGRKEESACIKLFGPVFITLSKIQAVYKYFYRPSNVEEKLRTEIR